MHSADLRDAYRTARAIADEVCQLLRGAKDAVGPLRNKSSLRDLVTEWDLRAEELIVRRLAERSPGVAVVAEEGGGQGDASASACWLVDPIDGTVNFAHGLPLYATALSLEVDGEPVVGVVAAPALDWTFAAMRGEGATMNDQPIRVSAVDRLERAMLATGFPYDAATNHHNFAQWEHFQIKAGACRRLGAASLDLCLVARGWLDGYWETQLHPWDISAGALLVREAGGEVTGITGEPFSSRSGHAVASNGAIHKEILSELAVVGIPNP